MLSHKIFPAWKIDQHEANAAKISSLQADTEQTADETRKKPWHKKYNGKHVTRTANSYFLVNTQIDSTQKENESNNYKMHTDSHV